MNRRRSIVAGHLLCLIASGACSAWGQTAEMTSKESSVTFKSGVNLVPVPVVVRDSHGHAVGNLGFGVEWIRCRRIESEEMVLLD